MRITNKIMRNNSLYNINQNKMLEDKLSNQTTNQTKITRPSDDPVVAIRALRLRTNVTMVSQYYEKNAEDAKSWISLTGDSLAMIGDVLTDLYKQAMDSSKKSYTYADLDIVLTQMKSLTKEFFASGNVDYAGRYIFSGYRTDTPITLTAEDIKEYTKDPDNLKSYMIEQNLSYDDISTISYTDWRDATDIDNLGTDERNVENTTLYRMRLAYDHLNAGSDNFHLYINGTEVAATQYENAEDAYEAVKKGAANGGVDVAYIPSTGEIVFSQDFYENKGYDQSKITETMQVRVKYTKSDWEEGDLNPVHYFHCIGGDERSMKDAMALEGAEANLENAQSVIDKLNKILENVTDTDAAEAAIDSALASLDKLNGQAGMDSDNLDAAKTAVENVRTAVQSGRGIYTAVRDAVDAVEPVVNDAQTEVNRIRNLVIEYNPEGRDQDIYYDVGFNQNIQVNTHANEVFTHDTQRDIDDFQIYLKQLKDVEDKISDIKERMKGYPEDSDEYRNLQLKLDAANKAYTYVRENVQKKFENQITKYQKYIDATNVAVTNNGTRGSRLELISSRLMEQKATFKDLQVANEGVDTTEVAVQLKSAELTYEAALLATSKIMQTNLMNYI